jgi:hypothetical protein
VERIEIEVMEEKVTELEVMEKGKLERMEWRLWR